MPDALPKQPLETDTGTPSRADQPRPKRINLALQGGGSHGAFTWGVLDALLEDGRIEIEAVTGTSAGAMNAAVLAGGYARGGRDGARADLARFWRRIGELGRISPIRRSWLARLTRSWRIDDNPFYALFNLSHMFSSPYQRNPLALNPLRGVLEDVVDFDLVRRPGGIRVYVSATDVESGRIRIFRDQEICADAVLASACLPQLFQAVEYEGRHYWDGGYTGNPPLWPIFYDSDSRDVVLVQINPTVREGVPKTPFEIMDRLNEITFNASLFREMRAVRFVSRLIDNGHLDPQTYKKVLVHAIQADADLKRLHASSKYNAEPDFLEYLFELGRRTAAQWLDGTWNRLGQDTSINIVADYM